jgi:hypothetical protein
MNLHCESEYVISSGGDSERTTRPFLVVEHFVKGSRVLLAKN